MNWPWNALGLDGPAPLPEIRRAYAAKLKSVHPEEDPEGFQRLHAAYQSACRLVRRRGGAAEAETEPPVVVLPPDTETPEYPDTLSPSAEPDGPEETPPVFERDSEPEATENAPPLFGSNKEPEPPENSPPLFDRDAEPPEPQWDFERLFREAEAERQKAQVAAFRVRVARASQLLQQVRRPFERKKDALTPARVMALQAMFLLEEPDPVGGWELSCKVLLGHESFQAVLNDPLFIRCLTRFFREHPDLPQAVRNAFYREYGFSRRRFHPLKFRPLCRVLESEQTRRQRRNLRIGNLLSGLLLILFLASVWAWLAYYPPWRFQGAEWLEEDFGMEVRTLPGGFAVLYSDGQVDFAARREKSQNREEGQTGYQTNLTAALLSYEVTQFANSVGWSAASDRFRSADTLDRPGGTYLNLPLTGAGNDILRLADLLEELTERDWYNILPPDYKLYLCWQSWCFYESDDSPLDGEEVKTYYEENLGPAMCTVLAKETGIAQRDLGRSGYVLLERGRVSVDGEPYFVSAAVDQKSGETLGLFLLSEDGGELFCLPPDTPPARASLYAQEPETFTISGFSEPLNVRDYLKKPDR